MPCSNGRAWRERFLSSVRGRAACSAKVLNQAREKQNTVTVWPTGGPGPSFQAGSLWGWWVCQLGNRFLQLEQRKRHLGRENIEEVLSRCSRIVGWLSALCSRVTPEVAWCWRFEPGTAAYKACIISLAPLGMLLHLFLFVCLGP